MEFITQTLAETDWRITALTVLCGAQMYNTIKKTFNVPWSYPENVVTKGSSASLVTVYVFKGSGVTVSSSPFSSKIEMYCRLAGIPHEIKEADYNKAPKNKTPYIEHDGNMVGDSELIIRYLENTFNVSYMSGLDGAKNPFIPFAKLNAADRARSELIRVLCEETLYWGIMSIKWAGKAGICKTETAWHNTVENYFDAIPAAMRGAITSMIRVDVLRDAKGQGLNRHSPDDQLYLMKRAVETLSTSLGKQSFFLGAAPTECDCIAFATLDCLLDDSHWPNELTDFLRDECPNLVRYHRFIRDTVFEDMQVGDKYPAGRPDAKGFFNER